MIYIITLKTAPAIDLKGSIGKELLRTGLFLEITHHPDLDYNSNCDSDERQSLIICKTKETSTDYRKINEFLEKINKLLNDNFKEYYGKKEMSTKLYQDGWNQN